MTLKLEILAFLFLFCSLSNAGNGKIIDGAFASYSSDFNLSKRWGIHFDGNVRSPVNIYNNIQFVLRGGGFYNLNPDNEKLKMQVGLGYALREEIVPNIQITGPAGNTIGVSNFYIQEHIIWQQFQMRHRIHPFFIMSHRLRPEQVWSYNFYTDNSFNLNNEMKYQNINIRYMIRPEIYFTNPSKIFSPYFALQEEVFLKIHNANNDNNGFSENRVSLNLGLKIKNHTQIEVGYMHRKNVLYNADINYSLFHFQIFQNINFYKSKTK
jgi:hypothetical protein